MSSAEQQLAWLWQGVQQSPYQSLCATWLRPAYSAHLLALTPLPEASTCVLAHWLAGLADWPEAMVYWLKQQKAYDPELVTLVAQALAREPETPWDWVKRSFRHGAVWRDQGNLPFGGYYSLRRLHFLTRGMSSQLLRLVYQAVYPRTLPQWVSQNTEQQILHLHTDSFSVRPQALSASQIRGVREFADRTSAYPSLPDQDHRDIKTGAYTLPRLRFDPEDPVARRYDFHFAEIWHCEQVQDIAADLKWFALAEEALGCRALLVQAYLWWSSDFSGPASRYTGQVFHIDLDRFHFVNAFFYLTDVGENNGPQSYFKGTHGTLPLALSVDQRWTVEALNDYYGAERRVCLPAPAGTLILANTQAFHRGEPLQEGHRLMLQLEFAPATLGENPVIVPRPPQIYPALRAQLEAAPWRYPMLRTWLD